MDKKDDASKADVVQEATVPVVVNFVDDAKNNSATTIAPIPDKVDTVEDKKEPTKNKEEVEVKQKDESEDNEQKTSPKNAVDKRIDAIAEKKQEAQEKINEAIKARRQKERELDKEIKKNQELQLELEKIKTAKPVAAKPKQEEFETEAAYIEALTDWKLDVRLAAAKEDQAQKSAGTTMKQDEERLASKIAMQMKKGNKKYEDFDEVVKDENVPISVDMLQVITDSEIGEEILYYLGTHVDEAVEMSEMNPLSIARAIGKLEAKLTESVKPSTKTNKKESNAPPPIKPVQTLSQYEPTLDSLSYEEYKARRKAKKQ